MFGPTSAGGSQPSGVGKRSASSSSGASVGVARSSAVAVAVMVRAGEGRGVTVSTAIGVYLNLALKNLSFIPQLIIPLNFLYGLAFFALACFLFGFSMLYLIYINKVVRASIMWQKSLLSEKYGGNNVISSLNNDKYKKIALYSGIVFLSLFAAAYVVSAIVAGSFEFWHVWKWFGK